MNALYAISVRARSPGSVQESEHSVLMHGTKLCWNKKARREGVSRIGAFDKACDF